MGVAEAFSIEGINGVMSSRGVADEVGSFTATGKKGLRLDWRLISPSCSCSLGSATADCVFGASGQSAGCHAGA